MFTKPTFTKSAEEDQYFIELKEQVKDYLQSHQQHNYNQIKIFLFPTMYLLFWSAAMYYKENTAIYHLFYGLMGLMITLIFVNLIHDACHQTLFISKRYNKAMMYLFDFLGANSYIWINRHIRMHHNYPNTIGLDTDIEQGGPLKLFPSEKHCWIQKYQHLWFVFLYPLFMLNWLLLRDFKDFYGPRRYIRKFVTIPTVEYYKLWFFKLFFLTYIILIPVLIFNVGIGQALVGFLLQTICGSLLGLVILIPSHANVGNEFPVPDENNKIATSWLRHQFSTTNDVTAENFVSKHIMNNFNYHLAHHLFPNITASQVVGVTKIIRTFAAKYNLPYKSHHLITAFRMHYLLLKINAIKPKIIFEETM